MAKASWLTLNPNKGSGNGVISNTATEHTGRVIRTCTITVTAKDHGDPKEYTVSQTPKAEFVSFDNGAEMACVKGGETLSITGKSNSPKLNFTLTDENGDKATLAATYTANGVTTNNGADIAGDPGADAEYAFAITLEVPANATVEQLLRTLTATGSAGNITSTIAIKQTAGDPTLSITPTSITIPQNGAAQTVQVTSNTSWQAE